MSNLSNGQRSRLKVSMYLGTKDSDSPRWYKSIYLG